MFPAARSVAAFSAASPVAWINRIELTVWDPAAPSHKRVISGPSGQAWISTMWDGKLYVDGNENNPPFYAQASDVFMEATVFWNNSSPQKPWENVDGNTFQEPRLVMHRPTPVWSGETPYRYYSQGVVLTSPTLGTTNIPMQAFLNIGEEYPQARVLWEVPAAVGSIPGDQINSTAPVHTSPATPGFGYIRLKSEYYSVQYQAWLPTPAPYRSWGVKIYAAHFERDVDNEYSLDRTEPPPNPVPPYMNANCTFAAFHGWNGTGSNISPVAPWNPNGGYDNTKVCLYDSRGNLATSVVAQISFAGVTKGDCVTYVTEGGYPGAGHIETFTADGTGSTWGANTAVDGEFGHWTKTSVVETIQIRESWQYGSHIREVWRWPKKLISN